MAFSMKQLRVKPKINVRQLYAVVYNMDNVSDEVKRAIAAYLNCRIHGYGTKHLELEQWKYEIKELISKCCGKDFIDVKVVDTQINYNGIIQQLRDALVYRRVGHLYNDTLEGVDVIKLVQNGNGPQTVDLSKGMTDAQLAEYFGGIEI